MERDETSSKEDRWFRQSMVFVIMVNPLSLLATVAIVTGVLFGWRQAGAWMEAHSPPKLEFRTPMES